MELRKERGQLPPEAEAGAAALGIDPPAYWILWTPTGEELHALLGYEPLPAVGDEEYRWHLSVAARRQLPSWRMAAAVARQLRPGCAFVVGVGREAATTFTGENGLMGLHLWETKDPQLLEMWARAEGA